MPLTTWVPSNKGSCGFHLKVVLMYATHNLGALKKGSCGFHLEVVLMYDAQDLQALKEEVVACTSRWC